MLTPLSGNDRLRPENTAVRILKQASQLTRHLGSYTAFLAMMTPIALFAVILAQGSSAVWVVFGMYLSAVLVPLVAWKIGFSDQVPAIALNRSARSRSRKHSVRD
jgi:hypothetical protein